jgi:hypothetical protein
MWSVTVDVLTPPCSEHTGTYCVFAQAHTMTTHAINAKRLIKQAPFHEVAHLLYETGGQFMLWIGQSERN